MLAIAGTRPECIKLASVARALQASEARLCVLNSGQHRAAVEQGFAEFGIRCDMQLPELSRPPNLHAASTRLFEQLRIAVRALRPDYVLVQGDTLTAYCGALASAEERVPCAHVEAGLRTESAMHPFPEEWFRRRIAPLADLHLAPTAGAALNLAREGVAPEAVRVVGNSGIDALALAMNGHAVRRHGDLVVATLHRRENWDRNADHVCMAIRALLESRPELRVVFALHANPAMAARVRRHLDGLPRVRCVPPMTYGQFIDLARSARLLISDSGGIQEEAAHLGTPLLVPRRNTERPEALSTGFVGLVDMSDGPHALLSAALETLASPMPAPLPIDRHAPFGDGKAGERIAALIMQQLQVLA